MTTMLGDGAIRTARKPHRCTGCLGHIAKGERYHCSTWVDGGFPPAATTLCVKCWWVWINEVDDEWFEGDLAEGHQYVPADVAFPAKED